MTTKNIKLQFDNTISGVAGFPLGKKTFENQVKEHIQFDNVEDSFEITFPANIERISSSFIQGFFAELIEKYGFNYITSKIVVKTSSADLSKSIFKVLE